MRWFLRLIAAAVVLAVGMGNAQAPARRVALVIANGAYQSVPALTNPVRDGELIVRTLERAGFEVGTLQRDLTKAQFDAALRDFKRRADSADIALVYYAGHGIELEEQNWLLPVDARISDPADALVEGVSLSTILRFVQGARRARIVVLDACRNNPFALRLTTATRAVARGLKPVEGLPAGTVVAYSASFGQEAAEGLGQDNSPFAAALARRLLEPGLEVRFLFATVRDDVIAANASSPIAAVRSQRPWIGAELSAEQIFFVAPVSTSPAIDRSELPPPPAPKTRVGETFKECDVCPEMAVLPAGNFIMGSPQAELHRIPSTEAQHPVAIPSTFAVGRFEVTFAQWDACVADGGCAPPEEGPYSPDDERWGRMSRPVINVSWHDAKRYVRWLNAHVGGKAYRLLTEAEWEYAARAGTTTAFSFGPTITPTQAQYDHQWSYIGSPILATRPNMTAPVGSFPANAFKLHDMHGNVWEWVEDCYVGNPAAFTQNGVANITQGVRQACVAWRQFVRRAGTLSPLGEPQLGRSHFSRQLLGFPRGSDRCTFLKLGPSALCWSVATEASSPILAASPAVLVDRGLGRVRQRAHRTAAFGDLRPGRAGRREWPLLSHPVILHNMAVRAGIGPFCRANPTIYRRENQARDQSKRGRFVWNRTGLIDSRMGSEVFTHS